jgi:hypothetical protein
MSKIINTANKMKKVEVRCREGISELFKIDQLYCVLNGDYDIHVNGSIEMTGKGYGNLKKVKVYANLCNEDGAILYILNCWKNYPISEGFYNSFSLYCSTIGRFFDPSELEYVELYLSFNEKDS